MLSNSIYEQALALFEQFCPTACVWLPFFENTYTFCKTESDELNVQINGCACPLHDPHSAKLEADTGLSPYLETEVCNIYVYGVGLGYTYLAAKEWLKKDPTHTLIFIEDDLSVLSALFHTPLSLEILQDPQVYFICAWRKNRQIQFDSVDTFWVASLQSFFITALTDYENRKKKRYLEIVQAVHFQIRYRSNYCFDFLNQKEVLIANTYQKLAFLDTSFLGQNLKNIFYEIPCIICGAAVSITEQIPQLSALRDYALIFAPSSAMNVLNHYGFQPHFGVGLDPFDEQRSRILTQNSFETPFFYTSRFSASGFQAIHGPKIYWTPWHLDKIEKWFLKELNVPLLEDIETGLSASTLSAGIGVSLGCDPVILIGMDMAYTKGSRYPKAVFEHPVDDQTGTKGMSNLIQVTNYEGKLFDTNIQYVHESEWMNQLAAFLKSTHFINGNQRGLGFASIPREDFEKVANEFLLTQYDLDNQIHASLYTDAKNFISKNDLIHVFKRWQKSLENCLQLYDDPIGYLTDLPQEVAYQNFLARVENVEEKKQARKLFQLKRENAPSAAYLEYEKERKDAAKNIVNLHLHQVKEALLNIHTQDYTPSVSEKTSDESSIYQFQNGLLRCQDLECSLNIEEPFKPQLIPKELLQEGTIFCLKESLRDGQCIRVGSHQQILSEQYYKLGKLHGPSSFFDHEGNLLAKSFFIQGKRVGKSFQYYPSGSLYSIRRFSQGLPHGIHTYFYPVGNIKTLLPFVHGKLDGKVLLYYPNGQMKAEISFANGIREGREFRWDENGTKIIEVFYNQGTPRGAACLWYPSGKLAKRFVYHHDGTYDEARWNQEGVLLEFKSKQQVGLNFKELQKRLHEMDMSLKKDLDHLKKLLQDELGSE